MVETAERFMDRLDRYGVKYDHDTGDAAIGTQNSGEDWVSVSYDGENIPEIKVTFFFGKDCRDVSACCYGICRFSDDTLERGRTVVNELNCSYRWVRFYIEDNEVCADIDAVIDCGSAGDVCFSLLGHMLDTVDEVYPELMRARYA